MRKLGRAVEYRSGLNYYIQIDSHSDEQANQCKQRRNRPITLFSCAAQFLCVKGLLF